MLLHKVLTLIPDDLSCLQWRVDDMHAVPFRWVHACSLGFKKSHIARRVVWRFTWNCSGSIFADGNADPRPIESLISCSSEIAQRRVYIATLDRSTRFGRPMQRSITRRVKVVTFQLAIASP